MNIQPKSNLFKWTFDYGNIYINIQLDKTKQPITDVVLIASYIQYLARYFFICDDRQLDIMQNFMNDIIQRSIDENNITEKIYEIVFHTFNQMEKNAIDKLFFWHVPPLAYSEEKKLISPTLFNLGDVNQGNRSFAKYTLSIIERNGLFSSIFDMSEGPDMVFLPITVGVFYQYITNKIKKNENIKKLNELISNLLLSYNSVNPRSPEAIFLPTQILQNISL